MSAVITIGRKRSRPAWTEGLLALDAAGAEARGAVDEHDAVLDDDADEQDERDHADEVERDAAERRAPITAPDHENGTATNTANGSMNDSNMIPMRRKTNVTAERSGEVICCIAVSSRRPGCPRS